MHNTHHACKINTTRPIRKSQQIPTFCLPLVGQKNIIFRFIVISLSQSTNLFVSERGEGEGERRSDSSKALYDVGVVPENGIGARDGGREEGRGREGHYRSRLETVQLPCREKNTHTGLCLNSTFSGGKSSKGKKRMNFCGLRYLHPRNFLLQCLMGGGDLTYSKN